MLMPLLFVSALTRVQLFVSPDGNDSWSGALARPNGSRTDGPLASIQAARDKLCALSRDVPAKVEIEAGVYRIASPVVFTSADSGTERFYVGPDRGTAVISGLRQITGWRTLSNGFIQTVLPEVREGRWYFSQLFVNHERRLRPRLPKSGYRFVAEHRDATPESKGHGFDRFGYVGGEIRADWANRDDVEVLAFHQWSMSRNRIKAVDEATHTVTFKAPTGYEASWDDFAKGGRYLVENVKEALSAPGEWYLDRPTGELTYVPKPGETAANITVEAPVADCLMRFDGDPGKPVHGIRLSNLDFEGTNWNLPPNGRNFPQAEADLSGAIRLTGTRDCSIENCKVAHTGEYAVEIAHDCRDIRVAGCTMQDLGAGGVKIGEASWERDPNLQTSHCEIVSNVINGGGRLHPAAVGVWIGQNPDIRVVGNAIHDLYYTGVSVGWSWGYQPNGAHGNLIAFNNISKIGQGVLSDMGGIYTLGPQEGTVLRGNRIHDVRCYSYGGWGIYPDEGSSHLLIEDNCVFRCQSAGFHQHYGEANRVVNNVFALNGDAQIMRTRAEDHLSFAMEHNIVYWGTGTLLGSNWGGNNYLLDHNCYWRTDGKTIDFAGMGLEEWRKKGQDQHSAVADPLFKDPVRGDFRLGQGSPAMGLGFHTFPALDLAFEPKTYDEVPAAFK